MFETSSRSRTIKGQRHGDRVNMRAAMQAEADPRRRDTLWERRLLHAHFDPLFVLALDCSSSMNGQKFEAAYDATVLLSEVCLRSGLPMALWIFNSTARQVLAPQGQSDTAVRRSRIDALRRACGGSTAMEQALAGIHGSPEIRQFSHPMVLVLGDGEPNNIPATASCISKFTADGVPLFGIGIGCETESMAALFPESLVVPNVPSLASSLAGFVSQTLRRGIGELRADIYQDRQLSDPVLPNPEAGVGMAVGIHCKVGPGETLSRIPPYPEQICRIPRSRLPITNPELPMAVDLLLLPGELPGRESAAHPKIKNYFPPYGRFCNRGSDQLATPKTSKFLKRKTTLCPIRFSLENSPVWLPKLPRFYLRVAAPI